MPTRHPDSPIRALIVDLNNFSRYPTMAVGYLAAALRQAGMAVEVLSPLAHGVPGIAREPEETPLMDLGRRANYLLAQAPGEPLRKLRRQVEHLRGRRERRRLDDISRLFLARGTDRCDIVLVSAYLMYDGVCEAIGRACREAGIPMIVGGSYFADAEVAGSWLSIPGLTALIGGEVELEIAEIVEAAVDGADLSGFAGVWLPGGRGRHRPPLADLDRVAFPDYSDFPWHRYPHRIVPMLSGRGCGWGACTFCSDVTSSAGRTFRSRSPDNVLEELGVQSHRHDARAFVFTDLKLNSDPGMWRALVDGIPARVPHAQWIAAVHVGAAGDHGLDAPTLAAARRAGAVRLTTGLESGSQRILDRWAKGTDLDVTSRFLHDAAAAGISVRVTMIHGAPGETAEDVLASARYLEVHARLIDRVNINRFQLMLGTTFMRRHDERPERYPSVIVRDRQPRLAQAEHELTDAYDPAYVRATQRLLGAVHAINRRPLTGEAGPFEGVM